MPNERPNDGITGPIAEPDFQTTRTTAAIGSELMQGLGAAMNNNRNAQRLAFELVPETCPKVDAALEAAALAIKEQTGLLRDALVEALERALNAEDRVDELEDEVKQLQRELDAMSA